MDGSVYDFKYFRMPLFMIPNAGTAKNTADARAAVVERDAVGGW